VRDFSWRIPAGVSAPSLARKKVIKNLYRSHIILLNRSLRRGDKMESITLFDEKKHSIFEVVAEIIVTKFNGRIVKKLDGIDQRYWDIYISDNIITLHWEHYLGISLLFSENEREIVNKIVYEIKSKNRI